ncbi:SDR family oxidoreductase [Streptomyces niger]|uniref:SDR family oxidoreductase n=1 Tax=Streptomyces niger TaxID=66373 RepID=UPI000699C904|nr:SDR family oxidoreductase [Streptomyces niger]
MPPSPSPSPRTSDNDSAARTYLVTGAASGIGKATADRLRAAGHTVIGADRTAAPDGDGNPNSNSNSNSNSDSDGHGNGDGVAIAADLATESGRAELVDRARELSGGRLDAVIACAGLAHFVPDTVRVNYFGAIATLEGLRPLLVAGTAPRAVVVASVAAVHPSDPAIIEAAGAGDEEAAATAAQNALDRGEGHLIYSSSKAALARWVRRTAVTDDWAGAGIPLNAIGPGTVLTPMTEGLLADPDLRKVVDTSVPMPLNGHARAEQIAPLLAWLTSPENTHVTGQLLFVDGGAEALLHPAP